MSNVSNPIVDMPIVGANTVAQNAAQRLAFVAAKLAGGSATAGELVADVEKADVATLFGEGSEAMDGFLAAREINPYTPIDIVPIDDPTGDAAVGSFLFTGTATAAKVCEAGISSSRNGVALISVAEGDDGAAIAQKVEDAFSTKTTNVCTVAVDGTEDTQANITYNHDGVQGNSIPIYFNGTIPGVTVAVTAMTGGSGVPTLTSTYAELAGTRYNGVAQVGEWGVADLVAEMEDRFNVRNKILDGTGFVCVSDTKANHITATGALNAKTLVHRCEGLESKSWYKNSSMFENNFARSCQAAALESLRLTPGVDISEYVNAAGGVLDGKGGPELASLPLFNTPMPYPVMNTGFGFGEDDISDINDSGGTVDGNNDSNSGVVYGTVVTTYKTDANGDADISFKYQEYYRTITTAREYQFVNLKKELRQSRATAGSLVAYRNINNEDSIYDKFVKYFGELGDDLLVPLGEDATSYYKENLSVTRDAATGSFTVTQLLPIVTQVRVLWVPVQMSFAL